MFMLHNIVPSPYIDVCDGYSYCIVPLLHGHNATEFCQLDNTPSKVEREVFNLGDYDNQRWMNINEHEKNSRNDIQVQNILKIWIMS